MAIFQPIWTKIGLHTNHYAINKFTLKKLLSLIQALGYPIFSL